MRRGRWLATYKTRPSSRLFKFFIAFVAFLCVLVVFAFRRKRHAVTVLLEPAAPAISCLAKTLCVCEYLCTDVKCIASQRIHFTGNPGFCEASETGLPRRCQVHASDGEDCAVAEHCSYDSQASFLCSRKAGAESRKAEIPDIVHWVWPGMQGETFPFWAWVHACAIVDVLQPTKFYFHHVHDALPSGRWWLATLPMLTLVPTPRQKTVYGRPVLHLAHQSDIMRLRALITYGGVYLDTDVLVLRSFAPLAKNSVILCVQSLQKQRTANAVILAQPHASFLYRWIDEYHMFVNSDWDAFSVRLPALVAQQHPNEVLWLPPAAWFVPGPDDDPGALLFSVNVSELAWASQPARFAQHLWHHITFKTLDTIGVPDWFSLYPCVMYSRMVCATAVSANWSRNLLRPSLLCDASQCG